MYEYAYSPVRNASNENQIELNGYQLVEYFRSLGRTNIRLHIPLHTSIYIYYFNGLMVAEAAESL